jgi:hypothetical protein
MGVVVQEKAGECADAEAGRVGSTIESSFVAERAHERLEGDVAGDKSSRLGDGRGGLRAFEEEGVSCGGDMQPLVASRVAAKDAKGAERGRKVEDRMHQRPRGGDRRRRAKDGGRRVRGWKLRRTDGRG